MSAQTKPIHGAFEREAETSTLLTTSPAEVGSRVEQRFNAESKKPHAGASLSLDTSEGDTKLTDRHSYWAWFMAQDPSISSARETIAGASEPEAIIGALRQSGHTEIADRLIYLQQEVEDDPDELPIDLESLRSLALFLLEDDGWGLPDPWICVAPNGFIQIEWRFQPNGILAMVFPPSDSIQLVVLGASSSDEDERLNIRGTMPRGAALKMAQIFIPCP